MITTTATYPREHTSSTLTTARRLLARFGQIFRRIVPILFTGQLITYTLIDYFGGSMSLSIWEDMGAAAPYGLLFAMTFAFVYIYLPLHVAHGGTRRGFIVASTSMVICASLLLAVMVQLGYLLESFIYARYGWTQALDHQHLFRLPHHFGPLLLEYTVLLTFSGALAGLAAAIYYRLGNLWATVMFGVMVLAPVTSKRLLIDPWLDTNALPLTIQMLLRLVLIALIVLITYLMVRRVPLRARTE